MTEEKRLPPEAPEKNPESKTKIVQQADAMFYREASKALMTPTMCRKALTTRAENDWITLVFGSAGYFSLENEDLTIKDTAVASIASAVTVDVSTAKRLVAELSALLSEIQGSGDVE